ncbi:Uncharacterised protein [Mycobacteroides abscessus subsp. abscessus]|uniref:hypothetical protein n=2 Tax=Mycobacteroides abscessus TaxID=36809 RepID=UPI0009291E84|nr:hypothetical protein [Mycobacteroides abscessus]SHY29515.1 Uncharacterised protein [Mycobacteroides abscessus subsp. abscessus]SID70806.1 Uncharacterised protein [Mycobacteroides abscessus subsp. abscessus]SII85145.1 Uncharacterised protein [Mycobacteroides abscessus subsp. abscessus]SIJ05334.1 Uncharacterised protein [Mycobacteroides abscessus subsp. abscessus]SIK25361.1 Uncharacterised protein [Mycobacteroides abscessus subsp. abscessus]
MNFVVTGWGYSGDPDMLPPYAADLQMFNFLAITLCVLNVAAVGTAVAHRALAMALRRTILPAVVAVDAAVLALWTPIAAAAHSVTHEQPEYQSRDLWLGALSWLLPATRILLIGVVSICMLYAVIQALFTTAELLHGWVSRHRRARDQLTTTSHEAMG